MRDLRHALNRKFQSCTLIMLQHLPYAYYEYVDFFGRPNQWENIPKNSMFQNERRYISIGFLAVYFGWYDVMKHIVKKSPTIIGSFEAHTQKTCVVETINAGLRFEEEKT